jgi:hypothetical protein
MSKVFEPSQPPATQQGFRLVFISVLAAFVGLGVGVVAFILYSLIGLVSNLVFFPARRI